MLTRLGDRMGKCIDGVFAVVPERHNSTPSPNQVLHHHRHGILGWCFVLDGARLHAACAAIGAHEQRQDVAVTFPVHKVVIDLNHWDRELTFGAVVPPVRRLAENAMLAPVPKWQMHWRMLGHHLSGRRHWSPSRFHHRRALLLFRRCWVQRLRILRNRRDHQPTRGVVEPNWQPKCVVHLQQVLLAQVGELHVVGPFLEVRDPAFLPELAC